MAVETIPQNFPVIDLSATDYLTTAKANEFVGSLLTAYTELSRDTRQEIIRQQFKGRFRRLPPDQLNAVITLLKKMARSEGSEVIYAGTVKTAEVPEDFLKKPGIISRLLGKGKVERRELLPDKVEEVSVSRLTLLSNLSELGMEVLKQQK